MTTTGTRGSATLELPTCPSAAEIAANVRTGRESAREACAAALARIAETESSVHAWHHLDAAQALERAQAIDDAGPQGALAGVPVAVKDIIDTADQPTENGTPLDAGRRPGADATVVRRLRAAGALILGKTVTTELACGAARATRNPHASRIRRAAPPRARPRPWPPAVCRSRSAPRRQARSCGPPPSVACGA